MCGDNTWINYKNSCFKVFNKKLTWLQAQAKCQQTNSNLIAIVDETIQTFISNLCKLNVKNTAFLILILILNVLK